MKNRKKSEKKGHVKHFLEPNGVWTTMVTSISLWRLSVGWKAERQNTEREIKMRKPLNSNQFLISFYRFYYCCDRRINNFLLLHWWQNDEMCHIQTWICFFLHLIFDGKKYDCEKGKRRFVDFIANKQKKSFHKFANLE